MTILNLTWRIRVKIYSYFMIAKRCFAIMELCLPTIMELCLPAVLLARDFGGEQGA
jgi:hypothetical protein